jgi:hypothetical protein
LNRALNREHSRRQCWSRLWRLSSHLEAGREMFACDWQALSACASQLQVKPDPMGRLGNFRRYRPNIEID